MKLTYKATFRAACTGYIVQAIVNNLAPLLFIAFQDGFGLSRLQITSIITVNFLLQLGVDLVCAGFIDRIGYRAAAVLSMVMAAAGLVCMGVLPYALPDAYAGLMIAVFLNALGGGLLEVIISPIVEALPGESKSGSMALLHASYCWGCVLVILLSTGYFVLFGVENWRWLPMLWAAVPAVNLIFFLLVPMRSLLAEDEVQTPLLSLFKDGAFWVLFIMMVCAGASEQGMSQWSSLFAETGLQVSKTLGDLLGPCLFAVLMGAGRTFFGRDRGIPLPAAIGASAVLCAASYLITVFSPWPLVSLLGCGVCGLSVAIFWPGTFSLAAEKFPRGGTALFAILALGGDLGCSFGPSVVGWVSNAAGGALQPGLFAAAAFPLVMLAMLLLSKRKKAAADAVRK
ncbi:MAG: MFS transporter [Oscillospiraceae bacterium]|nr:MFS transporter [Oscillospiraceae bacterium]